MSEPDIIVDINNLRRSYQVGDEEVVAVNDVTLTIPSGRFIAVVGRSGSGKTTLLNLVAGLDKPTSGTILFQGNDISEMNEKDLTEIRRHKVGFVFQAFGLLPLLSAFENVELPLRISGTGVREREERTREALSIVGLVGRANHRPYELSGGEQQRVAIARAIVTKPPLILADEPTGEVDSSNASSIFGLFLEMVRDSGITVVAATHDSTLLAMADQVNEMRDGQIVDQFEGSEISARMERAHSERYNVSAPGATMPDQEPLESQPEDEGNSLPETDQDQVNQFRRPSS